MAFYASFVGPGQFRKVDPRNPHIQASKSHLDVHGRGLSGVSGAQQIIARLTASPSIEHLILGNNDLKDDGIVALFNYLSDPRTKRRIVEISLNSCHVGNLGLRAICNYLNGNETLKSLFLQNNEFNPSWALVQTFTTAINNSRLYHLSLTSNTQLSDTFLVRFLPSLSCPTLQSLHLSAMSLTAVSTPYLVGFLANSGPSCTTKTATRLTDLRLNGNRLTLPCVKSIVSTLQSANFSIQHLEMFANNFDPWVTPITPDEDEPLNWRDMTAQLSLIFTRNDIVTKQAARTAFQLLPTSRLLLLQSSKKPKKPKRWRKLPVELRLHILALAHPGLSPRQYIKVFNFASDNKTLPPPEPAYPLLYRRAASFKPKNQVREEWLESVGCNQFEWYEGWEEDFGRVVA